MYECFLPVNHYYGYGSVSNVVILSDEVIEFMLIHKLKIKFKESDKDYKIISKQVAISEYRFRVSKPCINCPNKFIVYGQDRDSILLFRLTF